MTPHTYVPVAGAIAEANNVQSFLLASGEHFARAFTDTTGEKRTPDACTGS